MPFLKSPSSSETCSPCAFNPWLWSKEVGLSWMWIQHSDKVSIFWQFLMHHTPKMTLLHQTGDGSTHEGAQKRPHQVQCRLVSQRWRTKWILDNINEKGYFLFSGATFSLLTLSRVFYTQHNTGKTRKTGVFSSIVTKACWQRKILSTPFYWDIFAHFMSMQYVCAQFEKWWQHENPDNVPWLPVLQLPLQVLQ